jgi:hypothetical protein
MFVLFALGFKKENARPLLAAGALPIPTVILDWSQQPYPNTWRLGA